MKITGDRLHRRQRGQIRRHAGRQLRGRLRNRNHRDRTGDQEGAAASTSPSRPSPAPAPPSARDRFNYKACVVPKLKKNKLKAAKTRLRNADCKLGKVKKLNGATAENRHGHQAEPQAGQDPPAGHQPVNLTRVTAV